MAQVVEIEGLDELKRLFSMLPERFARTALTSAVRSGAYVIRKEVRRAAPVGPNKTGKNIKYGHLRDNIKTKSVRSGSRTASKVIVHTGKAYWGKFLEEGTVPQRPAVSKKLRRQGYDYRIARINGRLVKVKHTGGISANPWFEPAYERSFPEAQRKMADVIWDRLKKQINKLKAGLYRKKRR